MLWVQKWKWVLLPVDLSKKNPFYTVPAYSSLYQAVEIFSEGIHRIAVQESRDAILGILTQSNVSSYLYANVIYSLLLKSNSLSTRLWFQFRLSRFQLPSDPCKSWAFVTQASFRFHPTPLSSMRSCRCRSTVLPHCRSWMMAAN